MRPPKIGRVFWILCVSPMRPNLTPSGLLGWWILDVALFKPKSFPPDGAEWGRREMHWGFWWRIHFWLPIMISRTPR